MGRAIKVDDWQGTLLGRNEKMEVIKNGGNSDTSRGEDTSKHIRNCFSTQLAVGR
jgi:hypothetical protein